MAGLGDALRAAAEEAEQMQAMLFEVDGRSRYLEDENTRLKEKLTKAADLLYQLSQILSND
jgi:uncharacterized phage infection (PIP) family protein YhgE